MRLAVVGSRKYGNMDAVRSYVRALPAGTVIVTGGWPSMAGGYRVVEATAGVDREAYVAAEAAGLITVLVSGSKTKDGHLAGMRRNETVVSLAEGLVAFWDLKSPGTRDTLAKVLRAEHLVGRVIVVGPDGAVVPLDRLPNL